MKVVLLFLLATCQSYDGLRNVHALLHGLFRRILLYSYVVVFLALQPIVVVFSQPGSGL